MRTRVRRPLALMPSDAGRLRPWFAELDNRTPVRSLDRNPGVRNTGAGALLIERINVRGMRPSTIARFRENGVSRMNLDAVSPTTRTVSSHAIHPGQALISCVGRFPLRLLRGATSAYKAFAVTIAYSLRLE